eukprot:332986-Pelagomonas_calceolata.AAC.8
MSAIASLLSVLQIYWMDPLAQLLRRAQQEAEDLRGEAAPASTAVNPQRGHEGEAVPASTAVNTQASDRMRCTGKVCTYRSCMPRLLKEIVVPAPVRGKLYQTILVELSTQAAFSGNVLSNTPLIQCVLSLVCPLQAHLVGKLLPGVGGLDAPQYGRIAPVTIDDAATIELSKPAVRCLRQTSPAAALLHSCARPSAPNAKLLADLVPGVCVVRVNPPTAQLANWLEVHPEPHTEVASIALFWGIIV